MRDQFFQQTQLSAPPLISSVLNNNNNNNNNNSKAKLSLPRTDELSNSYFSYSLSNGNRSVTSPARSITSTTSANKKYYETDLDLTIKVPKKSAEYHREEAKKSTTESQSRVINISVTKSDSLNYVSQQNETNCGHVTKKEKTDDADKPVISCK